VTGMPPVVYPLFDQPLPDLTALLARADAAAHETLLLAARLATHRLAEQASIADAIERLHAPPWAEARRAWITPPAELVPSDLLRALFVRDAEAMLAALFGDRRDDLAYADFDAARRSWLARCEDLPRAAEHLPWPRWWARRWALVLGSRGPAPLTPMGVLQSLDGATLRSLDWLSDAYREGLITSEEALSRRVSSMADQGCPVLAPMAPAYLDRHQGLDALTNALGAPAEGAVLVGQPGSGRRSLLDAFGARLQAGDVPAKLHRYGFDIDSFHGGPMLGTADDPTAFLPPAAVGPGMILALTRHGFGAALGPDPDPTFVALVRDCARRCQQPEEDFRLILVATPEELEALVDLAPPLASLPRIDVPAPSDHELLAMWLCHAPAIEERARARVSLLSILGGLCERDDLARRDFSVVTDMLCERLSPSMRRAEQLRARIPIAELFEKLSRRHAAFRRLVKDSGELADLFALERALLGPSGE
jgi:hypothetical protein